MPGPGPLIVLALLGGTLFIALAALRAIHHRAKIVDAAPPPLAEHYQRLGEIGPAENCPCASGRTYGDCCREKDIAELRDDVVDFLWKPWSQRSYVGRRSSTSWGNRLERHKIPAVVLPEWVNDPGRFHFPIGQDVLRAWRPGEPGSSMPPPGQVDDPGAPL